MDNIFLQFYGVIIFDTLRQEFVLKEFSYSQLILKKDPKSPILSSIPTLTCKFSVPYSFIIIQKLL